MSVLPRKTKLGYLKFFEVYDDVYGPKCFSVKNEMEHLYLAYWCGDYEGDTSSQWVYASVSHSILDQLRRGEKSFLDVFSKSNSLFKVKTYNSESADIAEVETITNDELQNLNLPPSSFSINPDAIQYIAPESKWDFNLRIAKNSSNDSPERSVVTKVLDAFSEIVESLMKTDKTAPRLFPLSATYGSFDVKLGASSHEKAAVAIEQLNAVLSCADTMDDKLANLSLDPYRLKALLDITHIHGLKITLKPKTAQYIKEPIVISTSKSSEIIRKLEDSTVTFIDSNKVPQANNLNRVITIVKLRLEGGLLNAENIDGLSSLRQVTYYTHAAWCMGLLNKNLTVAPPGVLLCQKSSKIAKYQYLADRFESSDFGWAWMRWAKVSNIGELEPSSATNFVQESVKGLNKATSKRRATCLSAWLKILQKHRRLYSN
jgi:hypothetical protein